MATLLFLQYKFLSNKNFHVHVVYGNIDSLLLVRGAAGSQSTGVLPWQQGEI